MSHENLTDQLSGLSKEQLMDLLLVYARDIEEVNQRLLAHFVQPNGKEELKQLASLIRSYIRKSAERDGFVPYRNVSHAVIGAGMALEKGLQAQRDGDVLRAARISFCVLRPMLSLLQSCDDSDGIVGGIIRECLDLVMDSAVSLGPIGSKDKHTFILLLLEESQYSGLEGWDEWQLSLLESAALALDSIDSRQIWENYATKLEAKREASNRSDSFFDENIALMRYRLIRRFDGAEEAADFLMANMDHSKFRQIAIEEAVEQERYNDALQLAEEGERNDSRKRFPGLVDKWKKQRFEVYRLTNQIQFQRQLAEEFVMNGEYSYYLQLKDLYTPHEWSDVYTRILSELGQSSHWRASDLYVKLLIEEKESKLLLEYVRRNLYTVSEYYPYLKEEFPEEVYGLFEEHIEKAAVESSDRKDYKKVCKIIRDLIKAGGSVRGKEIIDRLRKRYPNRPALQDELSKVKS